MTKPDKAHTELPWHICEISQRGTVIAGADNSKIGAVKKGWDAELITRACNEHYETKDLVAELVEALKELERSATKIYNQKDGSGGWWISLGLALGPARTALRKAGAG